MNRPMILLIAAVGALNLAGCSRELPMAPQAQGVVEATDGLKALTPRERAFLRHASDLLSVYDASARQGDPVAFRDLFLAAPEDSQGIIMRDIAYTIARAHLAPGAAVAPLSLARELALADLGLRSAALQRDSSTTSFPAAMGLIGEGASFVDQGLVTDMVEFLELEGMELYEDMLYHEAMGDIKDTLAQVEAHIEQLLSMIPQKAQGFSREQAVGLGTAIGAGVGGALGGSLGVPGGAEAGAAAGSALGGQMAGEVYDYVDNAGKDDDSDGKRNLFDKDQDGDGKNNKDDDDRDGDGVPNDQDKYPRNKNKSIFPENEWWLLVDTRVDSIEAFFGISQWMQVLEGVIPMPLEFIEPIGVDLHLLP